MNGVYDRAIATARRLIEKYGQRCQWQKPAAPADGAPSWRDQRAGEGPTFPVSIAWFPPGKANPMLALIPQTEVPDHSEVGLMAAGDFEPKINDTINRFNGTSRIVHFDKLAPNGTPIMYTLYVKSNGESGDV
jgi:hypothetical protein